MPTDETRRTFIKGATGTAAALATMSNGAAGSESGGTPFLCITCGTQFAESPRPPDRCPICEKRTSGNTSTPTASNGPRWRTCTASPERGIEKEEEHLYSINTEPKFGIGQPTFLIQTNTGNVLWDCVGLIDDTTIAKIKELGGIAEIAVSHPHYYTSMVEWSRAFGGAPIHLHEAERQWVMRPPTRRSGSGAARSWRCTAG